jgi:predicted Zn-ribbon and HTH transcriptional regulator
MGIQKPLRISNKEIRLLHELRTPSRKIATFADCTHGTIINRLRQMGKVIRPAWDMLLCHKCNHVWHRRLVGVLPKKCPKCKRNDWREQKS